MTCSLKLQSSKCGVIDIVCFSVRLGIILAFLTACQSVNMGSTADGDKAGAKETKTTSLSRDFSHNSLEGFYSGHISTGANRTLAVDAIVRKVEQQPTKNLFRVLLQIHNSYIKFPVVLFYADAVFDRSSQTFFFKRAVKDILPIVVELAPGRIAGHLKVGTHQYPMTLAKVPAEATKIVSSAALGSWWQQEFIGQCLGEEARFFLQVHRWRRGLSRWQSGWRFSGSLRTSANLSTDFSKNAAAMVGSSAAPAVASKDLGITGGTYEIFSNRLSIAFENSIQLPCQLSSASAKELELQCGRCNFGSEELPISEVINQLAEPADSRAAFKAYEELKLRKGAFVPTEGQYFGWYKPFGAGRALLAALFVERSLIDPDSFDLILHIYFGSGQVDEYSAYRFKMASRNSDAEDSLHIADSRGASYITVQSFAADRIKLTLHSKTDLQETSISLIAGQVPRRPPDESVDYRNTRQLPSTRFNDDPLAGTYRTSPASDRPATMQLIIEPELSSAESMAQPLRIYGFINEADKLPQRIDHGVFNSITGRLLLRLGDQTYRFFKRSAVGWEETLTPKFGRTKRRLFHRSQP